MNVPSHGAIGLDQCLVLGSSGFIRASYGDYWKFMKKLITTNMLGSYALERSKGVRAVELMRFYRNMLDKAMNKQSVEIHEEALRFLNNILDKMSMGGCFMKEKNEEKVSKFSVELAALTQKIFLAQVLRSPLEKIGISPFKKEIMDVSNRFEELLENIIAKYEEKVDEHQCAEIMDKLLAASRGENAEYKITRKHIKALLAELFFGAGETSTSTMRWTMAELINNPKILERLRGEIDSVVGKTRLVEETDLPKLPYLQAVIKEFLRLHPAVPLLPRDVVQGCKVGGFYVPESTSLVINVYAMMRDHDSWKDPDDFKLERFLEKEEEKREKLMKFLPFGSGRRGCPGSNLSHILVGIAIGVMVQCFDWKIEGEKVNMEEASGRVFLAMAHPLECTPRPRILIP
ncbi:unnamed protein product [Microthlaspi erraticum]|uniref:Cytochrome P450 n=1 Tax=Microthlaspi erraticum TaxID=1685480 RepID=A0A6D2KC43_9BRAS|nr:unnamed protein product [Microthlaspi erraticum]